MQTPFRIAVLLTLMSMQAAGQSPSMEVTGFFTEYGAETQDYVPADIPADYLTRLNYAFSVPRDTDGDDMYECSWGSDRLALEKPVDRLLPGTDLRKGEYRGVLRQIGVLKRSHPKLKVLLSVGGSCAYEVDQDRCLEIAPRFREISQSESHIDHFVDSCVEKMSDPIPGEELSSTIFNGIDLDWEFPEENDKDEFTNLVNAFAEALVEAELESGQDFSFTIDGAASRYFIRNVDISAVAEKVDYVNIMSYGFYMPQSWNPVTGPHAPAGSPDSTHFGSGYNIFDASVSAWTAGGMPADKIMLGLPLYGVGYSGVQFQEDESTYTDFLSYEGALPTPEGTDGTIPYRLIQSNFGVEAGFEEGWDSTAEVPYRSNRESKAFISYDNGRSLIRKILRARRMGLAGVFMWELAHESSPGVRQYPLTRIVAEASGLVKSGKTPSETSGIHVFLDDDDLSQSVRTFDIFTDAERKVSLDILDEHERSVRSVFKGDIHPDNPVRFEVVTDDLSSGAYSLRVITKGDEQRFLILVE